MTLQQAKEKAQNGTKMTHEYFADNEYMTMRGNMIVFEDGAKIFFDEWVYQKGYLLEGWSEFKD
jgi:lipopolysaccharide export system protein LptA